MRPLALIALILGLGCGIAAAAGLPEIPEDESFSFVVMADNQPPYDIPGWDMTVPNENFKAHLPVINLLSPDFVVTCGDMIGGYVDEADVIHKMWDNYLDALQPLEAPHVKVPGNHDVWDAQSQAIFQERIGPLYFSFDHKGSHFVALCAEVRGEMDFIKGEQLEWLKKDLEAAKDARRIFVFIHKPLWRFAESNWDREVHPLLVRAGVDTVFCGHWHQYQWEKRDGIRYIIQGGGGAPLGPAKAAGGFYHFLNVTVRGGEAKIAVVGERQLLPETIVTRESAERVGAFGDMLQRNLHCFPAGLEGTRHTIEIHLANPLDAEATAAVSWDPGGRWVAYPAQQTVAVPARGEATVALRLASGDDTGPGTVGRYQVTYTSPAMFGEYVVSNPVFVVPEGNCRSLRAASVDGDLGEWPNTPDVVLQGGPVFEPAAFGAQVESPEDLSARVWYGWDASNLHVAVAVTDDAHHSTRVGDELYNGDGVIIAIDPVNNGRDPDNPTLQRFDADDWQICVARTKNGVECWGNVKGQFKALGAVNAAVKLTGEAGNAVYEIAVPWSELGVKPKRGMQIGFSVKICEDDDGKGRAGVMAWTEPNNPVAFATLTLR